MRDTDAVLFEFAIEHVQRALGYGGTLLDTVLAIHQYFGFRNGDVACRLRICGVLRHGIHDGFEEGIGGFWLNENHLAPFCKTKSSVTSPCPILEALRHTIDSVGNRLGGEIRMLIFSLIALNAWHNSA